MTQPKFFDARFFGALGSIALIIVAVVLMVQSLAQLHADVDSVHQTYTVIDARAEMLARVRAAAIAERKYIMESDKESLADVEAAFTATINQGERLLQEVDDNPAQTQRVNEVLAKIRTLSERWDYYAALFQTGGFEAVRDAVEASQDMADLQSIDGQLREIEDVERGLLRERLGRATRSYWVAMITSVVSGAAALAAVLTIFILLRRQLAIRTADAMALNEHAERLRTTLASIGDAVITTDARGQITMLNRVAERLTGWSESEALGRPLSDVLNIETDATQPARSESPQDASGGGLSTHTILVARDGTECSIDQSNSPIMALDGALLGSVLIFRDITEQRHVQARIRESELRYRLIGEAANDAIWDWDLLSGRVVWNDGIQTHFGYSPDEVEEDASWFAERIHRADRERALEAIRDLAMSDVPWSGEFRMQRADGSYATVWGRRRAMFDETGQPVRIVGSLLDLTERLQADQALHETEERVRMAVEAADIGTWDFNPATGVLKWSERCKAIFGLPPDAEITYDVFLEQLHPEDRTRTDAAVQVSLNPHGSGQYQIDYRTLWPSGEIRWVVAQGQAIFDETQEPRVAVRFTGTVLDITERKLSEFRLRDEIRVTESLYRIGSIVSRELDLDKLVQAVTDEATQNTEAEFGAFFYNVTNEAGESYSFYTLAGVDQEEFSQFPMPRNTEIFGPTFRGDGPVRFDDVTQAAGFGKNAPYAGLPEGHLPVRSYLAVPVVSPRGEVLGGLFLGHQSVGVFTSRHERLAMGIAAQAGIAIDNARLYRQARDQMKTLQNADRRKDEFLATLAHELRNPLAPIRTGLELMKLSEDDPAGLREIRDIMERQTMQLITLVDDLLDVSRITRGKLELRLENVELSTVVRSALEASQPFLDEAGHQLATDVPAEPIWLKADPHRLVQVLSNLLNNAAKYTPRGGTITLAARPLNHNIHICVRDTGIGIPKEMLDRVFEMFTQVDRPQEKGYSGLGIGLTLVKSMVEMHGGNVTVQSEGTNRGSEFCVRLPVVSPAPNENGEEVDVAAVPASQRRRVLVVDDNKAAALMVSRVIQALGHEVQIAEDGSQAIRFAEEFRPEIVLMDLGMPTMNGYEAAQRIRGEPWGQSMKLIALTGWGQEGDKQRTRAAGFDLHLVKPAEPAILRQILSEPHHA